MRADLDFSVSETVEQLEKWGHWFSELTKIDGFRLDAIKHIDFKYFDKWLEQIIVVEYWSDDLGKLEYYLEQSGDKIQLFDVPLHFNMKEASSTNGEFDMRTLFDHTLTAASQNSRSLLLITMILKKDKLFNLGFQLGLKNTLIA